MQRKPKKAKGFSAAWLHRGCIITVFGKPDWLFRLADVPFLALRHPGVGGADIRVSTVTRPGCRHVQHPGVIQLKTVISYPKLAPDALYLSGVGLRILRSYP